VRGFARTLALLLVLYVASYIVFRQVRPERWDRDGQTYVIYPDGPGRALYYAWRPLSYMDDVRAPRSASNPPPARTMVFLQRQSGVF
jgi:hypothetical protein